MHDEYRERNGIEKVRRKVMSSQCTCICCIGDSCKHGIAQSARLVKIGLEKHEKASCLSIIVLLQHEAMH